MVKRKLSRFNAYFQAFSTFFSLGAGDSFMRASHPSSPVFRQCRCKKCVDMQGSQDLRAFQREVAGVLRLQKQSVS